MPFVNEIIPEAEKNKFTFPVDTGPGGEKPTLWKWTVDRERAAFLVHTSSEGGPRLGTEQVEHYVLIWGGKVISFIGKPVVSGDVNKGYVLAWRLDDLIIPMGLEDHRGEVLQLIREALDVMGLRYSRNRIVRVEVDFEQ
jgi:hypothetical protein